MALVIAYITIAAVLRDPPVFFFCQYVCVRLGVRLVVSNNGFVVYVRVVVGGGGGGGDDAMIMSTYVLLVKIHRSMPI